MSLFPVPFKIVSSRSAVSPPAVSVIVTLYNYGSFIGECLDSIVAQTFKDLEIIVVDDVSRDDSCMVALNWFDLHQGAHLAYQLVRHEENVGLSLARNTGFALASAPLVFVMDADNSLYPRAVGRCVEAIEASGADAAYTQHELFGERPGIGQSDFWNPDRLKHGNYIDAMALVRKSAWERVGGYAQLGPNGWEDYDFWCKFVEQNLRAAFVPEILCRYRVHSASMSRTETVPGTEALVVEMSIRHPWLEL